MTLTHAVLFDWRGTLVSELDSRGWAREALRRANRDHDHAAVAALLQQIKDADGSPSRMKDPTGNTSWQRHHDTYYSVFEDAGLPSSLADALWEVDSDPAYNRFADDAGEVIAELSLHGIKVGVLSNIHFDIRPMFADAGLLDVVDEFVLSGEVGIQKPDPKFFHLILDRLSVQPEEALMVGDRASRDGAAVEAGIPTILVPALTDHRRRQLHIVTRAVMSR